MEVVGYDSVKQHLHRRYLCTRVHTAWLGYCTATFPLWNLSGQLAGVHQYKPNGSKEVNNNPKEGKYFTRLGVNKSAVWGLESWSFSNTLFVCEGLFDASKVTWLGYSAVALFGNSCGDSVARWLHVVRQQRKVVALCDSDKVGLNLAEFVHEYYQLTEWHDVGSAPLAVVANLCKRYEE